MSIELAGAGLSPFYLYVSFLIDTPLITINRHKGTLIYNLIGLTLIVYIVQQVLNPKGLIELKV